VGQLYNLIDKRNYWYHPIFINYTHTDTPVNCKFVQTIKSGRLDKHLANALSLNCQKNSVKTILSSPSIISPFGAFRRLVENTVNLSNKLSEG